MSYRDWTDEQWEEFNADMETHYQNLPTVPLLSESEDERARELFQQGWMTFGVYNIDQLNDIRDQFFDLLNITEDQFDWEDFRDAYSEVNG